MRLDNFDLNLLVAFDALLEERSVTRAARRLNVTQSAMSASLKRLREAFEDELLVQHGKKMFPTQHALALAPEVGSALMRLRRLISTGTGFDPASSRRRFKIEASDYITTVLLAPLIRHLQDEAPGLELELSLPNKDTDERLANGDIDLLITPEEFIGTSHPRDLLFEERHVVVGSVDNPVLEERISLEQFMASGHVAVRISGRDTYIEAVLHQLAPERRVEVIAPSFVQLPWLLQGTRRLAVMHERLARLVAGELSLKFSEPPFELQVMREMMQFHATKAQDAGLTWLRGKIAALAA